MKRINVELMEIENEAAVPRRIELDGEWFDVLGVADRWQDKKADYYKIRASDGCAYIVRLDLELRVWHLIQSWVLDA